MMDIAIDSSVIVAYLAGSLQTGLDILEASLKARTVWVPPVVISELMSYPGFDVASYADILDLPQLEIEEGYWQRAGAMRRTILMHGLKANLPDTFIAQSCIDHAIPLLTHDRDFRHFAGHYGLKLVISLPTTH